MITTTEIRPGVIEITIQVKAYGDAGKHWQRVLGSRNHGGYGKIYIERFGIGQRRRDN